MTNLWVFDLETYPNVFTAAFEHAEYPLRVSFEVSQYCNDGPELLRFLFWLKTDGTKLVGFNNIGFDYPILHTLLRMGKADYAALYDKCQAIINTPETHRFQHLVKPSEYFIPQIDLFKIHHFDNAARATSLKSLEFNMRSESIQDLPFPVGTALNQEQITTLRQYNAHDVAQAKKFYHHSKAMLAFRDELSAKYGRDFTNHNDTKIGKDYFVMELERAGVACYDFGPKGRTPRQTPRPSIALADAILPWIKFEHPEFQRVLDWLKTQTITETKGVFKDVVAGVGGLDLVFGTGGIHASVEQAVVRADDEYTIIDLDVTSYYPNLAIKNGFAPEHLGAPFVHIYGDLFEQRKKYDKKSAESAMLKLALNGVYGDSNNKFSVFYDPLFTMRITLNGQLLLCLLAEQLLMVPALSIVQVNTDGITVKVKRDSYDWLRDTCREWEHLTRLNLEEVHYDRMYVRDVNSYLAVTTDGKVKRKGAYEYVLGWHQNAGALVVPKVVEQVLVHDKPIRKTVEEWPDVMDFMLRTKVPRSGKLQWGEQYVQNITRYYVAKGGQPLTKWLPPRGGVKKDGTPRDQWRSFAVESGWNVQVCNEVNTDLPIDYEYYIKEVEALVMRLK